MKLISQTFSATFLDPNVLAGEYGTQVDLPRTEANPAAHGHGNRAIVERILELGDAAILTR